MHPGRFRSATIFSSFVLVARFRARSIAPAPAPPGGTAARGVCDTEEDESRAQANGAPRGRVERGRGAGERADLHELQRRQPGAHAERSWCSEAQPGRSYQLTGTVAPGSVHRAGEVLQLQRRGPAGGDRGPARLHGHGARTVLRRPRGDRDRRRSRATRYIGERNSLITKCPSKYKTAPPTEKQNPECLRRAAHERPRALGADGRLRLRLPAAGAGRLRLRDRRLDLRRPQRRGCEFARVRAALGVRAGGHPDGRPSRCSRSRSCATTSPSTRSPTPPAARRPTFYRAAAVWSSQEGSLLLWAWLLSLWSSLALFLTRRRMRDIAGLRDGDPARLRRVLRVADGLLREPVRDDQPGARSKASAWTRCCASRR